MLKLAARFVCSAALACALSACDVYNSGLIPPDGAVEAGPLLDAKVDTGVCVPVARELCNGRDDDCDGSIDEDNAFVAADCAQRIQHASSICQNGTCVFLRECDPGYYNCDGIPQNGCEASCDCRTGCSDAAADDGGAEDAG
jgi:hypothetical protein